MLDLSDLSVTRLACSLLSFKQWPLMADSTIMNMFSPEFAQHWLADRSESTDVGAPERRADEALSPSQQEALDALAERVSAARSVF